MKCMRLQHLKKNAVQHGQTMNLKEKNLTFQLIEVFSEIDSFTYMTKLGRQAHSRLTLTQRQMWSNKG